MAKKTVTPKNQSDELRRAKLEFVMRNPEERQKLMELFARNEKKRDEISTRLASIGGEFNPEQKKRWDFFFENAEVKFDQEFAEYLKKIDIPDAVNAVWRWADYTMEIEHARLMLPRTPGVSRALSYDELKERVLKMHCHDAEEIFAELTGGRPAVHLLLGVDLTRSKEVIKAEVEKLIDEYQKKIGMHEVAKTRFKWLPMTDDLLAVWDAWEGYGKRYSFRLIAKKLQIPESTAKDRWRKAYQQIYRKDFSPRDYKKSAVDICANCKDAGKCNRLVGKEMTFHPCAEYQKRAGKDYMRERLLENFDAVADANEYDNQDPTE